MSFCHKKTKDNSAHSLHLHHPYLSLCLSHLLKMKWSPEMGLCWFSVRWCRGERKSALYTNRWDWVTDISANAITWAVPFKWRHGQMPPCAHTTVTAQETQCLSACSTEGPLTSNSRSRLWTCAASVKCHVEFFKWPMSAVDSMEERQVNICSDPGHGGAFICHIL